MNQKPETDFKVVQRNLNLRIIKNLSSLLETRGLTPTLFMNQSKLENFFSKQHFNRLFGNPDSTHISAATVALMCDFFGVTFENLISDNFNPDEYIQNRSEAHKAYLDIEKLGIEQKDKSTSKNTIPEPLFDFENIDTIHSSPKSRFFKGYLQNYFCYYFPTSSKESGEGKILYGRLELSNAGAYCRASLKIDTRGKYPETEHDFRYAKEYVGYTVISSSVQNVYCILFGNDPGEFCFIVFRYMFLNNHSLYCRIAEVLSSSSGTGARRPTALRMFISNTHIKKEHIPFVTSAIRLNYSHIAISKNNLKILANYSNNYKNIIDDILNSYKDDMLYIFSEKTDLNSTAEKYLSSKGEILEFIAKLRNLSYSYQYNKVSDSSDDNILNLLMEKGYYQDSDNIPD